MILSFKQDTMAQDRKDESQGSSKAEKIIPHENDICQVEKDEILHKKQITKLLFFVQFFY